MLLITVGLALTKIQFNFSSDSRVWSIDDFPTDQRILYNSNNHLGAGSPATIIGNLDNFGSYDPKSTTVSGTADNVNSLIDFDKKIGAASKVSPIEPYRYGSFYFNRIDFASKAYELVTIANITSQDSIPEFSQFGFNAIMKEASGNANFKMEVTIKPFPISQRIKDENS